MGTPTKSSRVLPVMSGRSTGENGVTPTGADWGDKGSVSSKNGLVEVGRSGREPELAELAGDRARFRKGVLEPRLMGNWGDA